MQSNAMYKRGPRDSDFDEISPFSPRDPIIYLLHKEKPYHKSPSPKPRDPNTYLLHKEKPYHKSPSPKPRDPNTYLLHKEKTYRNDPPRAQAAFSPLSLQRFMLPQIDEVIEFCCKILENTQIEVALKKSKRGAAAAAGGAFLGGLLGGPPGIFIGGTMGSAVGWWITRGKFRPLHQIIMEMSPQQRNKLYSEIMENLGNLAWDDLPKLISSVKSNSSLKMQVLDILKSFARKQLRADVKCGKK